MKFVYALTALLVATCWNTPAFAISVTEAVHQYVTPMLKPGKAPANAGVAVGVYYRGEVSFFNFGVRNGEREPVDEHTLFEIGSVTKTFTAALLGEATNAGRIGLESSIADHLPVGLTLQPAAQKITPLQLADFTSGLPDDPPGLPHEIRLRGIDHYTLADFYQFLSTWTPAGPLPAPYRYSNTGVGLLGLILAGSIEGWEQQVRDQITIPLGMTDTVVKPSPAQRDRLAQGHWRRGEPAPVWPLYAWAAAGALRSTTYDLVNYLTAQLGHGDAPPSLVAAMALTHKPIYRIEPGKPDFQALTWRVKETGPNGEQIVFKGGATAGFKSLIGLNRDKDLAVVLLANWHAAMPEAVVLNIIGHINDESEAR
jgi:CubicO group peptidase (beta-lactamase class C family)